MFGISYSVDRTIEIDKPLDEVKRVVSDFNTWRAWSPWLSQEKECPVEITGRPANTGHSQSWDGERIGSGSITIKAIEENVFYYDLEFYKPWKAHSDVTFRFVDNGDKTSVTWDMHSKLPFFMFFLKKLMIAMIGSDYDRGLSMLKDFIEKGKADTTLDGIGDEEGFHYLGIKRSCTIAEMPDLMSADFQSLGEKIQSGELDEADGCISFYHKFDMVGGKCEYTSALTYADKPIKTAGLEPGEVSAHKGAKVTHVGEYKFLGNAWSAVMGYQRSAKLKTNKKLPWYERYLNNPGETESKDLITEIIIPVK